MPIFQSVSALVIVALGALLAVFGTPAGEYVPKGQWAIDPLSGCKVWSVLGGEAPKPSWGGPCRKGKADGAGTLVWTYEKDGEQITRTFAGEMKAGRAEGHGIQVDEEGTRYEGNFRHGMFSGDGVIDTFDGIRFVGVFRRGTPNGEGILTYPDGTRYEGGFRNSLRHGYGIETRADGTRYEGTFANGTYHGQGIMISANGNRFEGTFVNGEPHTGVLIYADGSRYEGPLKNGEPQDIGQSIEFSAPTAEG